ncbi:MAG: hypothetical protein ACI90V_011724, partial [Bacillariaceae sp.]
VRRISYYRLSVGGIIKSSEKFSEKYFLFDPSPVENIYNYK